MYILSLIVTKTVHAHRVPSTKNVLLPLIFHLSKFNQSFLANFKYYVLNRAITCYS